MWAACHCAYAHTIIRVGLHRSSCIGPPPEAYATTAFINQAAHQMLGLGSSDIKVCYLNSSHYMKYIKFSQIYIMCLQLILIGGWISRGGSNMFKHSLEPARNEKLIEAYRICFSHKMGSNRNSMREHLSYRHNCSMSVFFCCGPTHHKV